MARHVLTAALCLTLFLSCSSRGMIDVLRGNSAYGRGDYQSALVHYMVALESSEESGWIEFDMANVYYALGEPEAALETWFDARRSASVDSARSTALVYATSYNRGVLLYELGQFQDAYDEFRYALTVNSGNLRAKANLELALSKVHAAESASDPGQGAGEGDAEADESQESLRILEYVRRKEAQLWYANREQDSEPQPRDW